MVQRFISSKLTLTETFNLDFEHSNPVFSLDTSFLMMIYHQIEFGCKRLIGLELIKDIVQTTTFQLNKPILWPWPWRENPIFFHRTFQLMVVHHNTKFGYKRLQTNTQPSGNKYVSWALHPSPLKTPQCFPFCSQIIHHTQCKKRSAEVDLYVRVGRKLMVLAEIILLCAHMLHHFKTPRQPLLKKLL